MKKLILILVVSCLVASCGSNIKIEGEVAKAATSLRDFNIIREKAKQGELPEESDKTEIVDRFAPILIYEPKTFYEHIERNADRLDDLIEANTDKYGFDGEEAIKALTSDIKPIVEVQTDSNGQFTANLPSKGLWIFVTKRGVSVQTVIPDQKILIKDGSISSGENLKSLLNQSRAYDR